MFDTVTGKATANCTRYRRQNTAAPLTNLIAQQPACHRTAYGPEPGGRLLRLDCVDRDDFTCIRVDGSRSRWRLGGITVNIVVRVRGRWRRRTAMVVMNVGFAHRVGPRALLLRIRLSRVERACWLAGRRPLQFATAPALPPGISEADRSLRRCRCRWRESQQRQLRRPEDECGCVGTNRKAGLCSLLAPWYVPARTPMPSNRWILLL
ncbi:hypothetical protein OKW42_001042 [Paraburkholderia sp. WC7.3d]